MSYYHREKSQVYVLITPGTETPKPRTLIFTINIFNINSNAFL